MTYDLFIGDRTFSSWSLRGWLLLEKFGLPYRTHLIGLYSGTMTAEMEALAPARLVPTLRTPEGTVIGETMAIAEELATRHPEAGLWPSDPAARATARWLAAEMHAGFGALRTECPCQLHGVIPDFTPSAETMRDLDRLQELWAHARTFAAEDGPWLFGRYCAADAFYAPVAARIAGYGLKVDADAQRYVAAHLADEAFRAWRAEGLKTTYDPFPYGDTSTFGAWPQA